MGVMEQGGDEQGTRGGGKAQQTDEER